MKKLLITSLILLLCGWGWGKKPQGQYVATVGSGNVRIEMRYDFQENGFATFWIATSRTVAPPARGKWRIEKKKVLFEGSYIDPVTEEKKRIFHRLYFDGDDLFREDMVVRFVKQRQDKS
jgi:hypothetical protein